mmetsp:Transcript_15885/g.45665  ORF Transcript_15885/g.45665 Transcript_15885/m.45665 type:complete len:255 (+) Transcript_15885:56-820(+)
MSIIVAIAFTASPMVIISSPIAIIIVSVPFSSRGFIRSISAATVIFPLGFLSNSVVLPRHRILPDADRYRSLDLAQKCTSLIPNPSDCCLIIVLKAAIKHQWMGPILVVARSFVPLGIRQRSSYNIIVAVRIWCQISTQCQTRWKVHLFRRPYVGKGRPQLLSTQCPRQIQYAFHMLPADEAPARQRLLDGIGWHRPHECIPTVSFIESRASGAIPAVCIDKATIPFHIALFVCDNPLGNLAQRSNRYAALGRK